MRYYTAQHAMELNKAPDVQTVANLVKLVRMCLTVHQRWSSLLESLTELAGGADQLQQQKHAHGRHDHSRLGQQGRRAGLPWSCTFQHKLCIARVIACIFRCHLLEIKPSHLAVPSKPGSMFSHFLD